MADALLSRKLDLRAHVERLLAGGKRADGRALEAFRPAALSAGSISTAAGSAMAKLGRTTVVAGITASLEEGDEGTLEWDVTTAPLATRFMRRDAAANSAALLAHVRAEVERAFDAAQLNTSTRYAWQLQLCLYVLDDAGNVRDAAMLAALAALADCRLPEVSDDDEGETYVREQNARRVVLGEHALPATCAVLGQQVLADPSADELKAADAVVCVLVRADGTLHGVRKPGGKPVSPKTLAQCVRIASGRAAALAELLANAREAEPRARAS